jgi:hypothetical protein
VAALLSAAAEAAGPRADQAAQDALHPLRFSAAALLEASDGSREIHCARLLKGVEYGTVVITYHRHHRHVIIITTVHRRQHNK